MNFKKFILENYDDEFVDFQDFDTTPYNVNHYYNASQNEIAHYIDKFDKSLVKFNNINDSQFLFTNKFKLSTILLSYYCLINYTQNQIFFQDIINFISSNKYNIKEMIKYYMYLLNVLNIDYYENTDKIIFVINKIIEIYSRNNDLNQIDFE